MSIATTVGFATGGTAGGPADIASAHSERRSVCKPKVNGLREISRDRTASGMQFGGDRRATDDRGSIGHFSLRKETVKKAWFRGLHEVSPALVCHGCCERARRRRCPSQAPAGGGRGGCRRDCAREERVGDRGAAARMARRLVG